MNIKDELPVIQVITERIQTEHDGVKLKTYNKGRFLGKGGFAKVYELGCIETGEIFAGKFIPKELISSNVSNPVLFAKNPTPDERKKLEPKKAFEVKQFGVGEKVSIDYKVGDTVKHIKFGVGQVNSIIEGGRDFEVTVEFETAGTKKMFSAFANLKKL